MTWNEYGYPPTQSLGDHGVMVGRFCPVHLGHEAMISRMLEDFDDQHTIIMLGSMNAPLSFRNIFSYQERADFLQRVLPPAVRVIGIPDFGTNAEWVHAIDMALRFGGVDPARVTFYGGCDEDLEVLIDAGKAVKVINRFTGEDTPKVSATELRDALLTERSLHGLVSKRVRDVIDETFQLKLAELKRH